MQQRQKRQRRNFAGLKLLGLAFLVSSCVGLPKPPNTALGLYDNYSINQKTGRDYSKSPVFHMSAANGTEFEIPWNSKSAKNMVCTPHDDWVRNNAYLKKILELFQREYLDQRIN